MGLVSGLSEIFTPSRSFFNLRLVIHGFKGGGGFRGTVVERVNPFIVGIYAEIHLPRFAQNEQVANMLASLDAVARGNENTVATFRLAVSEISGAHGRRRRQFEQPCALRVCLHDDCDRPIIVISLRISDETDRRRSRRPSDHSAS